MGRPMTDLTPAQLAVARALVGDDWDKGTEYTDLGSRDTVVYLARAALAAARALIEAEVRATVAAEIRAMPARPDELPDTEIAEQMAVKVFAVTKNELFCGDIGWRAARTAAARIAEGGERRG